MDMVGLSPFVTGAWQRMHQFLLALRTDKGVDPGACTLARRLQHIEQILQRLLLGSVTAF
jgi:hypothetical protein